MISINCTSYRNGKCMHQAAPRRLFGAAECILEERPLDYRIPDGCRLATPHARPTQPIVPPPKSPNGEPPPPPPPPPPRLVRHWP